MTYKDLSFIQKTALAMAWLCLEDKSPNPNVSYEVKDFVLEVFIEEVKEYNSTIPPEVITQYFFERQGKFTSYKLYQVRHIDEDDENQPFVMASSVEKAFDKIKSNPEFKEWLNDSARDDEDIAITEFNLETKQIAYYVWNTNMEDWDVDYTNPILQ